MNHMLVAELLVADAKLKDLAASLQAAARLNDGAAVEAAERVWLKHQIVRDLIYGEMSRSERQLYELQCEHAM